MEFYFLSIDMLWLLKVSGGVSPPGNLMAGLFGRCGVGDWWRRVRTRNLVADTARERKAKRYVGRTRNRESWKERGLVGVGDMYIYYICTHNKID